MKGLAIVAMAGALNPVLQTDTVDRLDAALLAGPTATIVLTRWCAAQGVADARVHAEVIDGPAVPASAEQRVRLGVSAEEPLGYRRVRLACGGRVLSEAENWYVPSRLTPAMNAALAGTDTPFGTVIAPLGPVRRNLSSERLWSGDGAMPQAVLRHRALVSDASGWPLAEVVETYQRAAVEP